MSTIGTIAELLPGYYFAYLPTLDVFEPKLGCTKTIRFETKGWLY
jgi:hypothetical protein